MNSSFPLRFRPARSSDAGACGPLIFASGERESRFWLGRPDEQCKAFLSHAFASSHTTFSWRRHYLAYGPDGAVLSLMGAYHHSQTRWDDFRTVWLYARFFDPLKFLAVLPRGSILQHELVPPRRGQTMLTHFATDERVRGTGVFTAMLADAVASGWLRCAPDDQYVLDVRESNPRARQLYERLGFVAQPRLSPPSARLPAELVCTRMAWSAQGIAALRARAPSVSAQAQPGTTAPGQTDVHARNEFKNNEVK